MDTIGTSKLVLYKGVPLERFPYIFYDDLNIIFFLISIASTFVSLLLQVESTYEVHDYIRSFLGETDDVHSFAKQFLEKRQKLKNYGQPQTSQVTILLYI